MNRILFILILLFAHLAVMGQTDWVLKKDADSIRVFNRSNAQSKFDELRVEITLHSHLSDLAALILDIPDYPRWSFNSKTAYVLKRVGPAELFFYSEISSPWPVSNRDLIVHLTITQDKATRVMVITADETPDYLPPKKDLVRVPYSREKWTVTPLDKDRIQIDYQLAYDPGASVPAWMVNMFSTKGPYETFKKLRERIQLTKYKQATLSFITN